MAISEPTAVFSIRDDKDQEIKQVMQLVYGALEEKGYNPDWAYQYPTCCFTLLYTHLPRYASG